MIRPSHYVKADLDVSHGGLAECLIQPPRGGASFLCVMGFVCIIPTYWEVSDKSYFFPQIVGGRFDEALALGTKDVVLIGGIFSLCNLVTRHHEQYAVVLNSSPKNEHFNTPALCAAQKYHIAIQQRPSWTLGRLSFVKLFIDVADV